MASIHVHKVPSFLFISLCKPHSWLPKQANTNVATRISAYERGTWMEGPLSHHPPNSYSIVQFVSVFLFFLYSSVSLSNNYFCLCTPNYASHHHRHRLLLFPIPLYLSLSPFPSFPPSYRHFCLLQSLLTLLFPSLPSFPFLLDRNWNPQFHTLTATSFFLLSSWWIC